MKNHKMFLKIVKACKFIQVTKPVINMTFRIERTSNPRKVNHTMKCGHIPFPDNRHIYVSPLMSIMARVKMLHDSHTKTL
jgi:hypothetical protein